MILDQSGDHNHIKSSFKPDVTSSEAFGRPLREMNVASGLPQFCSLRTLTDNGLDNAYVQDDAVFIKAIVEP